MNVANEEAAEVVVEIPWASTSQDDDCASKRTGGTFRKQRSQTLCALILLLRHIPKLRKCICAGGKFPGKKRDLQIAASRNKITLTEFA